MLLWQRYEEALFKTSAKNHLRKRASDAGRLARPQGVESPSGAYVRPRSRRVEPMLEGLRFVAGFISLLLGAALIYDAIWNPGLSQTTAALLGGSALVSLGLICMCLVVRNWMEFRRYLKNYHQRAQK